MKDTQPTYVRTVHDVGRSMGALSCTTDKHTEHTKHSKSGKRLNARHSCDLEARPSADLITFGLETRLTWTGCRVRPVTCTAVSWAPERLVCILGCVRYCSYPRIRSLRSMGASSLILALSALWTGPSWGGPEYAVVQYVAYTVSVSSLGVKIPRLSDSVCCV